MIKLIQDHKIKIAVVLLAIFLWAYVKTGNEVNLVFNVPMQVIDVDPELVIENDLPTTIHVRFKGTGRALISLSINRDFEVVISVAGRNKGTYDVELTEENVELGRNNSKVQVVEPLSPSEVSIVLSPLIHKKVPIVTDIQIQTENGYELISAVQVVPESVTVSGPAALLDTLHEWHTKMKSYIGAKRDIHTKIELQGCESKKLNINLKDVDIIANIQKLMELRVENIPVVVRNVPQNWNTFVVPPKLSLTLEGGVDLLTNLKPEEINAYIDWSQIKPGKTDYPAYIEPPDNIRYRDVTPSYFKVVLERR